MFALSEFRVRCGSLHILIVHVLVSMVFFSQWFQMYDRFLVPVNLLTRD